MRYFGFSPPTLFAPSRTTIHFFYSTSGHLRVIDAPISYIRPLISPPAGQISSSLRPLGSLRTLILSREPEPTVNGSSESSNNSLYTFKVYPSYISFLSLLSDVPKNPLEDRAEVTIRVSLRYQWSPPVRDLFSSRLKPRIDVLRSLVLPTAD